MLEYGIALRHGLLRSAQCDHATHHCGLINYQWECATRSEFAAHSHLCPSMAADSPPRLTITHCGVLRVQLSAMHAALLLLALVTGALSVGACPLLPQLGSCMPLCSPVDVTLYRSRRANA